MNTVTEKIVVFRLAEDHFAADVQAVERVIKLQVPRTVPNVPPWVSGVVDYQKRVVPVVDLRKRFELPEGNMGEMARVLILHSGGEWIGVVVDAVVEVATLAAAELQPPPKYFRGLAGDYLRGLVKRGDHLVIVLDPDKLLSATERIVLETAAQQAAPAEPAPAPAPKTRSSKKNA